MNTFILVDDENLKILKSAATKATLVDIASEMIPHKDFRIIGVNNRCFSVYSHYELRCILYNGTGTMRSENYEYGKLIQEVKTYCLQMYSIGQPTTATDPVEEVSNAEAVPLQQPAAPESLPPTPKEEKPKKPKKPAGRPKPGTKTAMVWDTADIVKAANPNLAITDKQFRKAVVDACIEAGISKPTTATQFGKWKKYQVEQLT